MPEVHSAPASIGVLTSGGDAPGMNAAVRAVICTAVYHGIDVYAIHEGYHGLVHGGELIRRMGPADADGILHRGGTAIGTARSQEFRTRDGRRVAARNMLEHGIDALVVIGGDGSLTGADIFRQEWPDLLAELVDSGDISPDVADDHPVLRLAGLVGSIDNDMSGTDMTIGADTALHRIVEAMDALRSTASSHQRTFVVEVMGRHCGYLALMASLATAANWLLIPEKPPAEDWALQMCRDIKAGRDIGRRQSVVLVAEGAQDINGNPITADHIKSTLEKELGEDTRITILGHVQRGGAPSAFDRYLATVLGHAAVERLITADRDAPPQLIGLRGNRVVTTPLMDCVAQTQAIAERINAKDFDGAMLLRGGSFRQSYEILQTIQQAAARPTPAGRRRFRLAIVHSGGPAPGMNNAVRAFVRLGLDRGYTVLAVKNGFRGLRDGDVHEMDWMDVSGWVSDGGAEIGTNRYVPWGALVAQIAEQVAAHRIDGLVMAGGWAGYQAAHELHRQRHQYAALDIPIVCMPMTVNNDVPGTELSIGSDTALNSIVADVDKIRQSAVATRRVFVIEVMGHDCGYLALLSGLASGAERIYLPEEGITLDSLTADLHTLADGFRSGKRLGLIIRGEGADLVYTTGFLKSLFEKEGGTLFDARQAILGHIQEGGDPSPFDRIHATSLTARCIEFLSEQLESGARASAMLGFQSGRLQFTDLTSYPTLIHPEAQRPMEQRWMERRGLSEIMRC
ncbi:6-phosphofructokinase [Mycolicibacterium cyprinidarum]|uniref:6-phosphofructokinase n=1 Tax=Mycolicibacterium cyprinidarum TaxID=2860311 RepID=A0ABQ4V5H5_9MYCO|nr:6-phosphofructokinase [Mycolicibacterium sp. NGTWSNA01]GJF12649.1 6-phosphofructokinase [Mycolicibacterium sp. NGTWS1803]GJF12867.1 6-phosphofructokinase [Mycolicibacterium sp. NGTWS0302]